MHYELLKIRLLAVIFSVFIIVAVLELIRRRRLEVNYSLIWFLMGIFILICSSSQKLIYLLSDFFGIKAPINLFFIIIVGFILIMLIHFSMIITSITKQITKLAQEISLLKS